MPAQITGVNHPFNRQPYPTVSILLPKTGACSTIGEFFAEGEIRYAYFDNVDGKNGCCGTNSVNQDVIVTVQG